MKRFPKLRNSYEKTQKMFSDLQKLSSHKDEKICNQGVFSNLLILLFLEKRDENEDRKNNTKRTKKES